MSPQRNNKDPKSKLLFEEGTLNASPEKVTDPKFHENEFFDPRDLVQVKYEMLRRVMIDKATVTHVVEEYGFSRPTYYQTQSSFEQAGIIGLVPKKRGPRGPHKLSDEIVTFLRQQVEPGQPIRARTLAKRVEQQFGIEVHPRTIERALGMRKKNLR